MQPNGVYQGEYDLKCILHGTGLLGKFSRLRSALNVQGPGTLRHPWYGARTCVPKKWSVVRDDRDAGVLELHVVFLETGPPKFPGLISGIAASISVLSSSAVLSAFTSFSGSFSMPTTASSAAYVSSLMGRAAAVADSAFGQSSGVADAVTAVTQNTVPTVSNDVTGGS